MSNTNTGGPAFPSHGSMGEVTHEGMTLRDYFAAKAMQGLLANNNIDAQQIAKAAYIVADAMLKAREA
jgi:hypothetical protein